MDERLDTLRKDCLALVGVYCNCAPEEYKINVALNGAGNCVVYLVHETRATMPVFTCVDIDERSTIFKMKVMLIRILAEYHFLM